MIRLFLTAALSVATLLTPAWAQLGDSAHPGEAPIPPPCEVLPSAIAMQTRSNHGALSPSYVDDPMKQLQRAVPSLRGIKLEEGQNAADRLADVPLQDQTSSILSQTGAVIAAMLHTIPNLIAKEEVKQTLDSALDSRIGVQTLGRNSRAGGQFQPAQQDRTRVFNYRIVPRQDPAFSHILDEYRTDTKNHPVADSVDNSQSVGFGTAWLIFLPDNLQESRFRYLGRQKIGNHETHVLAFAQIPERAHLSTVVDATSGRCSTFLQGVAWIDQSTFRIVRMQTDLLVPLSGIHLNQLRSILKYGEVKIPQRNLSLWLPSEVAITSQTADRTGEELHSYSNYRLFAATSTLLQTDGSPLH